MRLVSLHLACGTPRNHDSKDWFRASPGGTMSAETTHAIAEVNKRLKSEVLVYASRFPPFRRVTTGSLSPTSPPVWLAAQRMERDRRPGIQRQDGAGAQDPRQEHGGEP